LVQARVLAFLVDAGFGYRAIGVTPTTNCKIKNKNLEIDLVQWKFN
jgi:hypothetical protein